MKKLLLRPPSLPSTRAPPHFPTSAATSLPEDFSSSIIRDKDLLGRSPVPQSINLRILELVDAGSVEPTSKLYAQLIKQCAQRSKPREGKLVHAHFLKSRFFDNPFFHISIIDMYCKCGSLVDASKALDGMPVKDTVAFTALITGYSRSDEPRSALELLPRMLGLGLKPNGFTFSSLFKACGAVGRLELGEQVHCFGVKLGCDGHVYVGSSLLDMYARCGKMDEACSVFDGLGSKNEVSWNALIAGHAREEDGEKALQRFWEMKRCGFEPTHFTYSSVFGVCASLGSIEQGKWIHALVIKSGQKGSSFLGNTLLDMYAKCGSIEDARKVFDQLERKDVISWNSMLTGCAQHGLAREAVRRFEGMLKLGVKPNQITFLCVLTACSHGGLLSEGERYFGLMKEYKIEPEVEHYVTMVDLLGRAGLLDRSQKFINEMPIRPTAAVWGALLGACRMHNNAELGQFAAERVIELDPHDSGPHTLLANIYASAGRWSDVARARKAMRASGVRKEPACSWVEIENSVHMFVANDESHPQVKEINQMWEEIHGKIKEAGYVPDTNYVLLRVDDEQERESKLQYHSEKLALAFALLNMPRGATIRIMKNIRMCGDCHCAIKLVSKVMEREIIVRDMNRFHHFSGGSCSCGDYW
ncbi:pentatricopeptide repeat-containing protein, mitochondrial [Iris pallida]|uniref:Pentatricopeptide repeat-containing protein, mitochondrial n=1 Tax=Iris pallida TaxID=29817 RepID=A0AAX6GK07_IRIPA|nr:pentatricopeptide repeat-containing protein, mitochondrial [Iris pallida]KAJ6834051.1 pentatricopeptide repeat-containing protein, mitochondrial [Iris pallida]